MYWSLSCLATQVTRTEPCRETTVTLDACSKTNENAGSHADDVFNPNGKQYEKDSH
jgi:hypothetical protein